jgi:hypothetical protein
MDRDDVYSFCGNRINRIGEGITLTCASTEVDVHVNFENTETDIVNLELFVKNHL